MPSLTFVSGAVPLVSSTRRSSICRPPSLSPSVSTTPRRGRFVCTAQPPASPSPESTKNASPPPASKPGKRIGLVTVLLVIAAVIWTLLISAIMYITRLFRLRSDDKQQWSASLTLLWMRDILRSAFVRVNVHGQENIPSGACLVVANSQSPLDMFALSFLRVDLRFMVPARAFKLPVLGWMLARAGWIGLDGIDRRSQMKALEDVGKKLAEGSSVAMFPEGSMNPSGEMKKFASPAFRAARKGGVPVLPVTVHGSGEMCEGMIPYRYPKHAIEVTVHPPIPLEAGSDKEISEMAHQAVKSALPENLQQGS